MVSCLAGFWDSDLVKAGAKANTQNKDGQTALMFLTYRNGVNEIRNALEAGADASIKDNKGRTAFDYLKLASCGKSPIADPIEDWMTIGYSKCTAFDIDDLHKAEILLRVAPHVNK